MIKLCLFIITILSFVPFQIDLKLEPVPVLIDISPYFAIISFLNVIYTIWKFFKENPFKVNG